MIAMVNPASKSRSFRGDRLRFIREKMGMTQGEMERMLGLGKGVISRYEKSGHSENPVVFADSDQMKGK